MSNQIFAIPQKGGFLASPRLAGVKKIKKKKILQRNSFVKGYTLLKIPK